jgi:hypothetical protein
LGAGSPRLAPEADGKQTVDSSSPPLARLPITLAGVRLSIEADAELIAFLRPLFHGRTRADDEADRSIRVLLPLAEAWYRDARTNHHRDLDGVYAYISELNRGVAVLGRREHSLLRQRAGDRDRVEALADLALPSLGRNVPTLRLALAFAPSETIMHELGRGIDIRLSPYTAPELLE